ncbi:hypothetical protein KXW20_001568 [Aspergillus fumigatus]|nr:hypothetical protein KXW20_001568 [Aspergillus fumigatus]
MTPSPRAVPEGSPSLDRVDRHNSTAAVHKRQFQKQRTQRATYACERCRLKKLRCTGGHPCGACRRAGIECDFGDRGLDWQQSLSLTNQRLLQLEKTVMELVSSLGHLTHPPQEALPQSAFPQARQIVNSPSAQITRTAGPPDSFPARTNVAEPTQSHGASATPERIRTLSAHPVHSEGLDSRWAALKNNSAPFPPLMAHPTVWSGEPAKTVPAGDPNAQLALGMTHYEAEVDLQSEPVSRGIVDKQEARALFSLFFQKCHPLFPLLEPGKDLDRHFDHIRSSAPFLFTAVLAVAGRYYTAYRDKLSSRSSLPPIAGSALAALADLAGAHLGFVLLRKQHQLSDVQATLLLSVWIPRGGGQSADQWMLTGLCTRLAYRIGVPDSFGCPAIIRLLSSSDLDPNDIGEANIVQPSPRQYLTAVRKLGPSAQVDSEAATYVTSLAELSAVAADLVSGLRTARLPPTPRQNIRQPAATAWSKISSLLSDLNPRLDAWQRQWTWAGSYDAVMLGRYTDLVKIYGEHTRLCLNSLSLNLLTANATANSENHITISCLEKACDAAVALVQYYVKSSDSEPIVRYGADYLVLILGQAAMFLVRVLVARLEHPLPVDRRVLTHHLRTAIELLESNDMSTTGICGWVAQLGRELARYAGLALDSGEGDPTDANLTGLDPSLPEIQWDFDICALLGQDIPAGETGLDLGHYFDFAQSFFPPPTDPGTL